MAAIFALVDLFLPVPLVAALVLATGVALTGAIHIDGLADFADGVFGGRTVEDRLRIMKLPDVGAFGLVAVVLVMLVDWTALWSMTATGTATGAWVALLVAGLVSRAAPLVVMLVTSYVPSEGLGQRYRRLSKLAIAGSVLFTFLVAFVIGGWLALAVAGVGLLMALAVGFFAKTRLGGATGDVYGASVELSFAVALIGAIVVIDAGEKLEPVWLDLLSSG
jgi:adenosylcobinamide-GDP ribazoletransferase